MESNILIITREKLYKEIWQISLTGVTKKYDLNYSKLASACKEYNIPYPTSAYWTKKKMGLDTRGDVIPLPELDEKEIRLELKNSKPLFKENDTKEDDVIQKFNYLNFLDENERRKVAIVISELDINKHKKLHKTILDYKNKIKDERREERQRNYYNPYYNIHDYIETGYFVNVSKSEKDRCMKVLSTIYYAIEELGGKINSDFSMQIRGEILNIEIEELKDKVNHELTKEEAKKLLEYEDEKKRYSYAYKPQIRKYDHVHNGKLKITFESKEYIKETDKVKLEDKLGDIIVKLYEKCERIRVERVAREEEAKRREEERKREVELKNRRKEEAIKTIDLVNKAEDYRIACEIRNYIKAVELREELDENMKTWIEWANKKADWFDPIIDASDGLLGKREHGVSSKDKNDELNGYATYYGWY